MDCVTAVGAVRPTSRAHSLGEVVDNPFLGLAARKRALERRALEEGMNVAGRWQAQLPMVREVLTQFGEALLPGAQVVAEGDRLLLRDGAAVAVEVSLAYDEVKRKIRFLVTRPHGADGAPPSVAVEALRGDLIAALIQLFPEWH